VVWVLVSVLGLVAELALVIALGRQVTAREEGFGHVDLRAETRTDRGTERTTWTATPRSATTV